ncbi:hypothetical protein B296_00000662 [Ensete ventricosum]|uniref:Uncharacterized protein n=1 Tax=Ensete ventricosum TaxID=4639 RepID=A0A426XKA6_ENSVE|nr:hypothetical protein B296_00000662 [Ensete ventricosum]
MRLGTRQECVGSSPRVSGVCQDGAREFTGRRPRLVGRLSGVAERLAESWEDDVVGSSTRTHQKFTGKFVESSPTGYRELTRSSLEEYWKFIGSSPKEIRSSLGVHRKDARSLLKR